MRVATWNVNGLRAAIRKGFHQSFAEISPDVLLLQEIRATPAQLPEVGLVPEGWHAVWNPGARAGHAGVAICSRYPIRVLDPGRGAPPAEGRLIMAETGGIRVCSLYVPSGSSGPPGQAAKEAWMAVAAPWLDGLAREAEPLVAGGDLNIALTNHDVASWRRAAALSGFFPHERAWLAERIADRWRDTVRSVAGERPGPYTWWSNFGRAKVEDRGWRLDYVLLNGAAGRAFQSAQVWRDAGIRCSDHAPVTADLRG